MFMKAESGVIARADAQALDATDALAPLREQFELPPDLVYLDGNSLGALPRATAQRLHRVVTGEWGEGLIRSWNARGATPGWIDLPQRIAAKLAPLIGVAAADVMVGDSTSVNLYKALAAALAIVRSDAPERCVIVTERSNFPTDRYIADSLARQHGCTLRSVDPDGVENALDDTVAVLLLTHVNYRSGRMHDMAALSNAAHQAGALVVWDLAHSAGAVPVQLVQAQADFAVGCGYKYLNGGPGAPAFLWAHPQHTARMDRDGLRQPLAGWFGHAAPFDFDPDYRAAAGIARFACGTPAVLSMAALECGLDVFEAARGLGGMAALRSKSVALTELFIAHVEARCAGLDLTLASPRESQQRGSQASFAHADAYPVMQALIERGVIGDYRCGGLHDPDHLLRFGFTPLYTRFVDAWDAAETLAQVLESKAWQAPRFSHRAAVT